MNSKQTWSAKRDRSEDLPISLDTDSFAIDGLDDPAELHGEADRAWREAMGRRLRERLMREGVIPSGKGKNALD